MSVTLAYLALTAAAAAAKAAPTVIRAAGDFIKENQTLVKGAIISAKPQIREASEKVGQKAVEIKDAAIDEINKYKNDGWDGIIQFTLTSLTRSYQLRPGKNVHGMGQAVKEFFCTYSGTKVTLRNSAEGHWIVSCVTESVVSAPGLDQKFLGLARKLSGNDVKITVTLIPKGNEVEVHYFQDISEALQAAKAVFISSAPVGVSKLYGIKERREIPIKLNAVISDYLRS